MDFRQIEFTSPRHITTSLWMVAIALTQTLGLANDFDPTVPASRLSGEIKVGKDGRLLLVPVQLGDQQRQFMVDTGACRTGIDSSLRELLGEKQGRQVLRTPAGRTLVDTFEWPLATLHGQRLNSDRLVAGVDFTELRQASNEKIYGVIGMDVLKNCRLQIDFDRGIMRFLDSVPALRSEWGIRIPMEFDDDDAPYVIGTGPDGVKDRFLIDTGAQGNSLRPARFDQLVEQHQIRLGGSFTSVTVGGEIQGQRGFLQRMSLGTFALDDLRMSRVDPSSLGLRYLSRFMVTFDFPERALYLRKSAQFSKQEPHATSGMSLLWIDGDVVVKSVKTGSPAAKANILADDVVMQIDGRPVSEFDHFSLRQYMTTEVGRKVSIRILREATEYKKDLFLVED